MAIAALTFVSGCGGGDGGGGGPAADPARTAVTGTLQSAASAVARGDPGGACRRLSPRGRRELARRAGLSCGAGVRKLTRRLPGPAAAALEGLVVSDVRVRGARAAAVVEPPSDLVELARATGVTYPLSARVRLVLWHGRWLIDDASAAGR
ncbi:MAG: hypothetical protein QOE08_1522 [Thermoleophilaceae bacterium]|nr:hypothetical protein [Thermoleophilaceae bacterium]